MTARMFLAAALTAALFTGCTSASSSRWSSSAVVPDPERWERAACLRGEYPVELDGRVMARARYEDFRASQEGLPTSAVVRLQRERAVFDERCSSWRVAMLYDAY